MLAKRILIMRNKSKYDSKELDDAIVALVVVPLALVTVGYWVHAVISAAWFFVTT